MDDENRLIEEAREGSMEAFSRLLRLPQAPLRAYLAGFIRDAEAGEDVAQEAFLGAYRNLEAYKGDAAFRTWLFGVDGFGIADEPGEIGPQGRLVEPKQPGEGFHRSFPRFL